MNFKTFFHKISYLQYPMMLCGLYFAIMPYTYVFGEELKIGDRFLSDLNHLLIFMGLGISFSTLQDTTKTQNNFSRKIWENPKKGKRAILFVTLFTFLVLALGLYLFLFAEKQKIKELSFGIIAFGIGLMGLLKTSMEMFDNHRFDKKNIDSEESSSNLE